MNKTSPFGRPLGYDTPCFKFPGDEAMSNRAYAQAMDNQYATILPEFAIAAAVYGATLDNPALERGRRMLAGQYWLDDLLDNRPDGRSTYETIVTTLAYGGEQLNLRGKVRPELATTTSLLGNAVRGLSEENRDQIAKGGREIPELSAQQVATTSMRTYIRARRREGRITGQLVARALMPDTSDKNSKKYTRWLERTVACLSLLDHTIDLEEDYKRAMTKISPTTMHKFRLGAAATRAFLPTLISRKGRRIAREAFWEPLRDNPELQPFPLWVRPKTTTNT